MEKKNQNSARSWLVIAMVAVAFFALYRMSPSASPVREMSVLDFYAAVSEGREIGRAHV